MSSIPPKQSLSSPTSGNSPPPVLPTPSSSTSVRHSMNKPALLKRELEQQLKEKQKQLQESSSGIGKNVLARQISQLEERIREIDTNIDLQPSASSSLDRLRALERDMSSYRSHPYSSGISSIRNKEKLLNQRSPVTSHTGEPLPSPSASTLLPPPHGHDSSSLLPLPPPPTGSTPTKRRSKIPNTDRRNTDIEFATEIGQGLLLEVRKMQALLQEKEEKLRILENQKADLERAAEAMAKQMRQREENEEKLKEETWNLELAKQELVISVTELQSNLNKANTEQSRLAKQVNELRSEIEQLRDKEEKLTAAMENMKQRHEQDMTSIRRQAASFQREKQEQTKKIEALTSELAIAKAQSRIAKHAVSDNESSIRRVGAASEQTENNVSQNTAAVKTDQSSSASPPSSPKLPPSRNQAMEVETMKTSLAHAHRMLSSLRSNLHKEKLEKHELKKLLEESRETIEQLQNDPRLWVDAGPSRTGISPNASSRNEDNQRRTRKVSMTSGKRRNKTQRRPKLYKGKSTNDGTYSSMSESEQDSFDDPVIAKTDNLADELLRGQKKVYVDAEVNTEPTLFEEIFTQTKPIEMETQTDEVPSTEVQTNALSTTTEIATQTIDSQVSEISVQTDEAPTPELHEIAVQTEVEACEMWIQTEETIASEIWTQTEDSVTFETSTQTDDQSVSEISTQTDLLDASEVSTQTDKVEPSEVFVQTDAAEPVDLQMQTEEPAVSEIFVQTLPPLVTEISTQTEVCVLEQASLDPHFETPAHITLEDEYQPVIDIQPEDPSIAAAAISAATAAAVAAARDMAIGSAIDQGTQYDALPGQDQETQYTVDCQDQETQVDAAAVLDHETQYEAVPGLDCAIQTEIVSVDACIQMDPIETNDMSVQYESVGNDAFVQHEPAPTQDMSVQSEIAETADISVQSDLVETRDSSIQFDAVETKDMSTQFDSKETSDISVQSEPVETRDTFIQYETVETKDTSIQYEPVETKDTSIQYEAIGTKDTYVQSLPVLTVDKSTQSEPVEIVYNSVHPETTGNKVVPVPLGLGSISDQSRETEKSAAEDNMKQLDSNVEEPISLNNMPNTTGAAEGSTTKDNVKQLDSNATEPMSLPNVATTTTAVRGPVTEDNANPSYPIGEEPTSLHNVPTSSKVAEGTTTQDNANQVRPSGEESTSLNDMPNKAKAAKGLATDNNAKPSYPVGEETTSLHNVPTATTAVKGPATQDNVNQIRPSDEESTRVHNVPIVSKAASGSAAEEEVKQLGLGSDNQAISNNAQKFQEPPSIQLSKYDNEEDEEYIHNDSYTSQITDIPARPSNPPPVDLLSKIHAMDGRSMSPISNRSYNNNKGKMPYDSYYDSENRSNEDLHNRSTLEKKPSISASSLSTNNTNEQLQSISSSQFGHSGNRSALTSTDPSIINLITQTMIGDWLWKYTRRVVGGGISEKRHQRYFWIHPYTRTLYWSTQAPGVDGSETRAKSALIENVKSVPEYANNGLPNVSLLIQTAQRQLKLTAPNMEKHEAWFEAISYLLTRNENGSTSGFGILNDANKRIDNHSNTLNNKSLSSTTSGSLLKRPSFRRIQDVFHHPSVSTSTHSVGDDHIELDDDDEPLEDVRMCCNGKHHVSKLERDHSHRHSYRKRRSRAQVPTTN